jgi:archaeal cell division control protein 6
VTKLPAPQLPPPATGRHLDDIRAAIVARLKEKDANLLVCPDDANYLIAAGTYNLLLYQLLRL